MSKVQNSIVKCFLGVKICNSTCLCNQRLDDNDDDHDASWLFKWRGLLYFTQGPLEGGCLSSNLPYFTTWLVPYTVLYIYIHTWCISKCASTKDACSRYCCLSTSPVESLAPDEVNVWTCCWPPNGLIAHGLHPRQMSKPWTCFWRNIYYCTGWDDQNVI